MRFKLALSLAFCFIALSVLAQSTIKLKPGRHAIGEEVEYYNDKTGNLNLGNFLEGDNYSFQSSSQEILNLGSSESPFWIRFQYHDQDSLPMYLQLNNSTLHEVDFFVVQNNKLVSEQHEGLSRRSKVDGHSVFWLFELPSSTARQNYTVYLRVRDFRRVILPLYVTDIQSAVASDTHTSFGFGTYFGILLLIALLNIFTWLLFKERIYLVYVFHIATQILINGVIKGYLIEFAGPGFDWLGSYIPFLAGLSSLVAVLFSVMFLEIPKCSPRIYKVTLTLCVFPIAVIVLNLTQQFYISAWMSTYSSMLIAVWLFILGVIVYVQEHIKQVRFYMAGWTFFFIGLFILNLALNNWIAVTDFTLNAAIYGSLLEVVLLTFALADRVNILRRAHEEERQKMFEFTEKHNVLLEKRVTERTEELAQKTQEVEAQNEELKQQHEELITINDALDGQNKLVEEQKKEIELINIDLEKKIQERTNQLEQTVKDLIKQNHDLEQFSYIISHNLRAPVARMIGLNSLFELRDKTDEAYEAQLQTYMRESALGLDQIINDLRQIIEMRKGLHTIIEEVRMQHVVNHVLSDLDDEIIKSKARVTTSLQVDSIITIKPYLQSILYNLLSNSLKYRSSKRTPEISLTISSCDKNISIKVKDNGMGIDLPAERINEIFNLYKRMHTHVEGKGLGLYLVKTQVESLQGSVAVESKGGEGTCVTIMLPKKIII